MNYGYLNFFISDIGESMDAEVNELEKYAQNISIDFLSYRPEFASLIDNVKEGDTIYTYNIARFSSGLRDLADTLKILDEKKVSFVSIEDNLTVDKSETGQAALNAILIASASLYADPNHGVYI